MTPNRRLVRARTGPGDDDPRLLCSGPGRLCEALAISRQQNGFALDVPPFELHRRDGEVEIAVGPRIGITKAVEHPWRYGLKGSRFLSKPFAVLAGENPDLAAASVK